MKQREVEITIKPDGKVEVHINGYKGKSCMNVVSAIESLVGKVENLQYTSEYYEPDEVVRFFLQQGSGNSGK